MDILTNNKWAVEIIESNMEGYTVEERSSYLYNLATHGCESGMVGGVIYYYETQQLFKNHMTDILEEVADYAEETGYNPITAIVEKEQTHVLYNYLVWFIIELRAQEMMQEEEEGAEEMEEA